MKKLKISSVSKKAVHALLGFASFAGIISSKAITSNVYAGKENTDSNTEKRLISNSDATAITSLIKYYWGKPNEVTTEDMISINERFGKIPSEEEFSAVMKKALLNLNTKNTTAYDLDGVAKKEN